MSILDAIILGIVQGVAEFLPISSSGHLVILHNLFNMSDLGSNHMFFGMFCRTSARLSLSALCTGATLKRCLPRLSTCFPAERLTQKRPAQEISRGAAFYAYHCRDAALWRLILPVHKYIEALSNSTVYVGIALILTRCTLLVFGQNGQGQQDREEHAFHRCAHRRPVPVRCNAARPVALGNDDNCRYRNGSRPQLCREIFASYEHSGGARRNASGAC